MKKIFKSKLLIQVVVASMVATLATAGIVGAATTIGSNINTAGTLTATGATTVYGATSIGGALTATSTLAVTGTSAFTGEIAFVNASSTGWIKAATIKSDTGAISFDNDNLLTTGTLGAAATTLTGALAANGGITVDTTAFTVADTTGNTTIAGTLGVAGATTLAGTASTTGSAIIKTATINSETGAISFGDENLSTTGTLSAGAATFSATGSFAGELNVNGYATTTAQGIISPGNFGAQPVACSAALTGGLIWGVATKTLCVCDGSAWIAATSTGGAACGY